MLFTWEKSGTEVTDMPYKPKVPCRHPGCPNLVPAGQKYCEEHKRMHPEENRPAAARGYNSRWRRESKKFLQLHPLCEECLRHGIATPATVVDHITSFRTEEIRSSSWADRTGRYCARNTTKEDRKRGQPSGVSVLRGKVSECTY